MAKETNGYAPGERIVHPVLGVGKVMGLECKSISGAEKTYYRIEMPGSILWIPVEEIDQERVRPPAKRATINKAVELLGQPPRQMSANFNERKSRIQKVAAQNVPADTARLIRDLHARRSKHSLNETERLALRDMTRRFLEEWAICAGIGVDQAENNLNRLLADRPGG